jgi:Xaa-Pro aminopeptidase
LWESFTDPPDWILIGDPAHLIYFANFAMSPFFFGSTDGGAMLILGADGSSTLVTDNLLEEFAAQAHVDEVFTPVWYRCVESAGHRQSMLVESVLDRIGNLAGTHVGFEPASVPAGVIERLREQQSGLKLTAVDSAILALRRSKDRDELDVLGRSMRAGEAAHAAALRETVPGMTELDVYRLVQQAAMREAAEPVIVYGDFVSGPRSEAIGGSPTHRVIEKSDLVLLDFSVVVHGYRGDFTNTFVCGAAPTAEQTELYEQCIDAIDHAEKQLRAGRTGRDVHQAVAGRLGPTFTTHSGHGIGLGHPEPPFFVPESSDTLVAGDVVALEPGQYVAGVGGMRYERNYCITDDGYALLTHHALQIDPTK